MKINKKKITTKELCIISMLLAITVVLSYLSGYLRIGTGIKFSISFISVYISGASFGPVIGGLVGAMADIISCVVNPVGALIWQLTAIEFIYGASFGIFFWNKTNKNIKSRDILLRAASCSVFQFVINVFVKTFVLKELGYAPDNYKAALSLRLPGCVIMLFLMISAIFIAEECYIRRFRKMIKNER